MSSLAIYRGNHAIHQIDGAWLYPLLELEQWLATNPVNTKDLLIYDKIVGRAGALLITRLGFRDVRTDLISELAIEVFERAGISWSAIEITDRILCATESLLENTTDPELAHQLIVQRAQAGRSAQTDKSILAIQDVNVIRDGRHILSAIDLQLEAGDRLIINGENGAGKTTLLRAVLGLIPINSGSLRFKGKEVGSPGWRRLRQRIGYVRQSERDVTVPINVQEVVGIGALSVPYPSRHAAREAAMRALSLTGVEHLSRRPFTELSGGEQHRVSIARALAGDPELLVLDEPTAGLDHGSRASLLQLIELAARDRKIAVLMVTHDPFDGSLDGWKIYTLTEGQLSPASNLDATRISGA